MSYQVHTQWNDGTQEYENFTTKSEATNFAKRNKGRGAKTEILLNKGGHAGGGDATGLYISPRVFIKADGSFSFDNENKSMTNDDVAAIAMLGKMSSTQIRNLYNRAVTIAQTKAAI